MIRFNETFVAFDSAKALMGRRGMLDFMLPVQTDRPRAPRIHMQVPLLVYGYLWGGVPFHEEARTIAISAQSGLIYMQTDVQPRQQLFVTNEANERTRESVVVFVGTRLARGIAVAFEFPTPMWQFWQNLEIGRTIDS